MDFVSMNIPRMFYKRIYFREIIYEAIDPKWIYIYIYMDYIQRVRDTCLTTDVHFPLSIRVRCGLASLFHVFLFFRKKKKTTDGIRE